LRQRRSKGTPSATFFIPRPPLHPPPSRPPPWPMVPATPLAASPKPPPLCFPRPSSRSMRACQPELVAAGFRGRRCRLELRAAPLAELVCGGPHPAAALPPAELARGRSQLILIFS
jgi:hypothetical protein